MGATLALRYAIDYYKEIAGEVIVIVIMILNVMGFAFGYAVTPMVTTLGLQKSFYLVALPEPPADRVLSNDKEITKERFSIPFLVQADRKKVVQCVKELEDRGAKYPPVSAEEYLNMRRKVTFKKF
ncbi:hypothetical protein V2G26_010564 [Clonostachys chloroleuca]